MRGMFLGEECEVGDDSEGNDELVSCFLCEIGTLGGLCPTFLILGIFMESGDEVKRRRWAKQKDGGRVPKK